MNNERYLETEILTATPQKLQLLLIETAMRYALQAKAYWQRSAHDSRICEALIQCQQIFVEVLCSLQSTELPEIAHNLRQVYGFLYQQVTNIYFYRDFTKLLGIIAVLEEERTTWHQLCLRLSSSQQALPVESQKFETSFVA